MSAAAFSPGCVATAWPRNTGRRHGEPLLLGRLPAPRGKNLLRRGRLVDDQADGPAATLGRAHQGPDVRLLLTQRRRDLAERSRLVRNPHCQLFCPWHAPNPPEETAEFEASVGGLCDFAPLAPPERSPMHPDASLAPTVRNAIL